MIQIGIGAGFASIFGTPLAGAVFALEVIIVGRLRYDAILPVFLSAFFANLTCHAWGIAHTHYSINYTPAIDMQTLLLVLTASIILGSTSDIQC